MRDVARLAGVSITTVSHVVNSTRAVAPETRAKVLDAIEQTGYTGDAIARSLVTGGTQSLGVAISLVANPHFAELIRAIEHEATRSGYTLVLADTHDDPETERSAVRMLRSRRVDGLVLTPSPRDSGSVVPELKRLGVPVVLLDRLTTSQDIDQVGPENVYATSGLVRHLAENGHRRIGMISGATGLATTSERVLGYRLGLGRSRLRWDESLVVAGVSADPADDLTGDTASDTTGYPPPEATGEQGEDPVAEALTALLALADPPTAVIAGNSTVLRGVLHECRRRGVTVGSELAVVGYDDVDWAELVDPPMTTVAQPLAEMGSLAVRLLLERIADPDGNPVTKRLPTAFMHRRSCGCD
ncbi:LacI family DNA-binding transcriptional regulator [Actinophytocola xanthii]|uniref:LacI family transcriptional regulator n=1 Tax=Actinophytocola xanthii TaxID=1912961 RepID=A0A1Q8CMQ5_9PSEU|nr:LacI family DNA-binding transcriptional regulator [Actinophytocola xanthii]OLF15637.1 LacI family transcriptional regulator [Actinophytocola xanthii]